jgi:DNA-binding NarL/FixJ family response regulator
MVGEQFDILLAALRLRPSIALVDLDLGRYVDGADLIGPLTAAGVAVVVVTAIADRVRWGQCIDRGARAVLGKTGPFEQVVECVRRLSAGLPAMPRSERDAMVALWRRDRSETDVLRARFSRLTPRERQVLGKLAAGDSIRDIAVADVVSEATVRTQVKSILAKLEVSSQLAAVVLVHRQSRQALSTRAARDFSAGAAGT